MAEPRSDIDALRRLADELPEAPARAALRRLLEALPDDQLGEARRILETAAGHGPLTEDEIAARDRLWADPSYRAEIEDSLEAYERGDVVDLDDALTRLGDA